MRKKIFCPNCGRENKITSIYCVHCGAKCIYPYHAASFREKRTECVYAGPPVEDPFENVPRPERRMTCVYAGPPVEKDMEDQPRTKERMRSVYAGPPVSVRKKGIAASLLDKFKKKR